MSKQFSKLAFVGILLSANLSFGQFEFDFFWSDKNLNEGAFNQSLELDVEVGDTLPLYGYWSTNGPADSSIDAGCAVDVFTSTPGIIRFETAETLEFDITVPDFPDTPIGTRWQDPDGNGGYEGGGFAGPADVKPDFIDFLFAFTVSNQGICEGNNGSQAFLDTGYDSGADAFLFGQMSFTAVSAGQVFVTTVVDESGCVNNGNLIIPAIAMLTVNVKEKLLLGDVNLDGIVNLLDVAPFVQILSDGGFQSEADVNQDGAVDLLDVPPFVDLLGG